MANEILKSVPLFADLPEEDLESLCEMVEEVRLPAGQVLFAEGDPGDKAYVIKSGSLEIVKEADGREVLLAVRGRGEVIGEMSLLEDQPRMAGARARDMVVMLAIEKETLNHLVQTSGSAARAMFYTILARWRATGTMLRQSEKMAQLGTLTAGVAHELNNPAAAVKRGADQLSETLFAYAKAQTRLWSRVDNGEHKTALRGLEEKVMEAVRRPPALDPLTRSDLEADLEDWLDEREVADAWDLAPALVSAGYTDESFEEMAEAFPADMWGPLAAWVGQTYGVYSLLAEIRSGAGRVSEIVKALKSYSYLDQAPVQEVDVHEGLDSTMLILRSKLKGIVVHREYDEELPRIQAYGSELNQVWTNILDNAADALEGSGNIYVRTKKRDQWVIVEIEDDGPGMPPAVQKKVFDAFFTTKPPGKGTGLGLDISYRIITHKHRGQIKLFSRPGCTKFEISLPMDPEESKPVSMLNRASDDDIREILTTYKRVATVGYSDRPDRPAHKVPRYLYQRGYDVIPVNPKVTEGLGRTAVPDLKAIDDGAPEIVQIFRRASAVPEIVEDAIAVGAKVIWMQEGIVHEQAAMRAQEAGLRVVMDTCMMANHRRLCR